MTLSFDGHDLESLFTCGEPQISILDAQPDLREVGGRNGAAFVGMTYGTASVAFDIAALGDAATRRAAFSTLGAWLMVDEPKALVLPDTPDRYYLAVPSGALDLSRAIDAELTQLAFELTDPVAYGATRTATLGSSGTVDITVGGTAPTMLNVTATSAYRDSTSLVWGVQVDNGDYAHVATGSNAARKVVINGDNRSCTLTGNNTPIVMTKDSDWLVLEPGAHTVTRDNGTGTATLSWTERWY